MTEYQLSASQNNIHFNLLLSPSESSRASDEVGIPAVEV